MLTVLPQFLAGGRVVSPLSKYPGALPHLFWLRVSALDFVPTPLVCVVVLSADVFLFQHYPECFFTYFYD